MGSFMRQVAGAWFCVSLAAILVAGCGQTPATTAKKSKNKTPANSVAKRPATPPPKVEQDAYASVDAAMAEVEELARTNDEDGSRKLLRIETWLDMQGAQIAPELTAMIKDPSVGLASRLTACRVLARQGPAAIPTLLEAADGEPQQLRRKAIESLGRVKPPSAEVIGKLVLLINDQDYEIRKSALSALARIGPPARQHDPKLVEKLTSMLNNVNEDETVRSLAKDVLKKIDPRRGLMDAH
jgi:HEAT repeat protein